jgi:hypothetical protein
MSPDIRLQRWFEAPPDVDPLRIAFGRWSGLPERQAESGGAAQIDQ